MYGRCKRPMARQLARKMGNALLLKSCPQGHEDEEQEEQEENGRSTSLYNTLCEFHTVMCRLSCGVEEPNSRSNIFVAVFCARLQLHLQVGCDARCAGQQRG